MNELEQIGFLNKVAEVVKEMLVDAVHSKP